MAKKTKSAGKTRKAPKVAKAARAPKDAKPRERDPRLPAAGTVLVRPYKGKDYRVTVLDEGFRYDGREFRSLSKLASAITGYKAINGFLWFGLTGRAAAAPMPAAMPKVRKAKGAAPKEVAAEAAPTAETATTA